MHKVLPPLPSSQVAAAICRLSILLVGLLVLVAPGLSGAQKPEEPPAGTRQNLWLGKEVDELADRDILVLLFEIDKLTRLALVAG